MKRALMAGVAGLALGLAGTPVLADPNGPYIAGDIGYHWPDGFDGEACTGTTAVVCTPVDVELGDGFAAFGRFGWRLSPGFRFEGELGGRWGDVESIGPVTVSDVDVDAMSAMLNILLDMGDPDARMRPFIGAGVGYGTVEFDDGQRLVPLQQR